MIDEAEDTAVFTGLLFVHKRGLKVEADVVVLLLFNKSGLFLFTAMIAYAYPFLRQIKAIVKDVVYFISVYADELVSLSQACAGCYRAFCNLLFVCRFFRALFGSNLKFALRIFSKLLFLPRFLPLYV